MYVHRQQCLRLFWIFCAVSQWDLGENVSDYLKESSKRPNIVFILTDDQDIQLGGTDYMPKLKSLLQKTGATFSNAFVSTPLCCPSRASILTGKYQHNHGTLNNSLSGNCNGPMWRNDQEKNTFVSYLKKANYTTFYAGKYLNQYGFENAGGTRHVPIGWDNWNGLVGNSAYYNYTLSVNGNPEFHGHTDKDYLTNVISERANTFIEHHDTSRSPFFAMMSVPASHAPFTPFPTYRKAFQNVTAPRTPHYNISGGPSKHWLIREAPDYLPNAITDEIDDIYRNRLRTLLSVDDLIESLMDVLREKDLIRSTFVFFASDNGYHYGQFSLPKDKRQMYEFDLRVPLVVSGPGIARDMVITAPVASIDFAPTFIELAGLRIAPDIDGMSFVTLLLNPTAVTLALWRPLFLIEYKGEGKVEPPKDCPQYASGGVSQCEPGCICEDAFNNTYACFRILTNDTNVIYCRFDDTENFEEMYDLNSDPYQLNNLAVARLQQGHDLMWFRSFLQDFQECSGLECTTLWSFPNTPR